MSNITALQTSKPQFSLTPQSLNEALQFADMLSKSNMVPKDYQGNPANCIIAMQWGMEIGLQPLQAMQNIAVINGRPAIWGDAMLAIVRGSGLLERITEDPTDAGCTCTVKRKGEPEVVRTFTLEDAKRAGLAGKQGPWQQHPKRMMQMRARAFALRDVFPDVLRGLPVAEEVMDAPPAERYMGPVDEVKPTARPELPAYEQATFEKNMPAWSKLVSEGKKTPGDLLATLSTRATFSEEQKAQILSLKKAEPKNTATDEHADFVGAMDAAEGAQ